MKQFDLQEYLKNPSRKVVTRDGKSVRIICTDRDYKHNENDHRPILALIRNASFENNELIYSYDKDGRYNYKSENRFDLFFAPIKKEGYINLYMEGTDYTTGDVYSNKEDAIKNGRYFSTYISTIKIEWEE